MAKISSVKYQGDWAQVTLILPKNLGTWLEDYAANKKTSVTSLLKGWIQEIQAANEKRPK